MSNWNPWQLKKSKSWGPFWSYQLNSNANQPIYLKIGPNWPNWQCCLTGSSKTAPRILIFFNWHGCRFFIWAKFEWIFGHNNSFWSSVYSLTLCIHNSSSSLISEIKIMRIYNHNYWNEITFVLIESLRFATPCLGKN